MTDRRPRARIRPEAMARARGGVREGLDWLGHSPSARAGLFYRAIRLLCLGLFRVLRFEVRAEGRDHIPPGGGWLLMGAAHRGWMDPFLVEYALPPDPRKWYLGSGPSAFTNRFREWLIRRIGGVLPVWRGGVGIDVHVRSARAVMEAGAVFVQMPEGNINGPAGRIAPFRPGAALIAIRLDRPIVPFAMAGTEEVYVGKRFACRLLPPTSVRELLGPEWNGVVPPAGTREELELAHRLSRALEACLAPVVEEIYPWTADPPSRPRPLRRRLTWLFLGPGPLEH